MDLTDLRKNIDAIDNVIVEQFQKRMETAKQIAEYKKEHDLPVMDEAREKEKLEEIENLADNDMAHYCRILYNDIMKMSRDYQQRSMKQGEDMPAGEADAYSENYMEIKNE